MLTIRIRLTRKFAQLLNGVDVSRWRVGDIIDLPRRDAELLLAEGWARLATDNNHISDSDTRLESPRRRSTKPTD